MDLTSDPTLDPSDWYDDDDPGSNEIRPVSVSNATATLDARHEDAFALVRREWLISIGMETDHTASLKASVGTVLALPVMPERPPTRRVSEHDDGMADFVIGELIGQGGVGVIHRARQRGLGRSIALKRLRPEKRDQAQTRASFVNEGVVTAALDHPNIVSVHELSIDEAGDPFYTMKEVHGQPWAEVIGRRALVDDLEILIRVCDAVAYAHSQGVLHRDLKPANVMIGSYGEVVVMDWGLAASVPGQTQSVAPRLDQASGGRVLGGTPAYMPPEMALGIGATIGIHSDIYLLGAMLFEILEKRPPHVGESVESCLRNAAANRIIEPQRRRGELLRIAYTALATEPHERYDTVWRFQQALRDYLGHAESMQLVERSAERLDHAIADGDYLAFARALHGFEEALELWPANRRAERGRRDARWAYAAAALEKDDLDLAASIIGGEEEAEGLEDLVAQLASARQQRARKERAERRLADVEAERHRESDRKWHNLVVEDLADESFRDRWDIRSPGLMWHPGELRLWGGNPGLIVYGDEAPGDVRLCFDVRIEGDLLNDISCFLAASSGAESGQELRKHGYEFKFGAFENTRVCLYRAGTLVYDRKESPLEYGRTYQVVAERIGQVLRMSVDGRIVIDYEDEEVLAGGAHHVVGIVAWRADYCFSNLRVERLGAPLKADLLEVAADHLSRGHVNTAIDLYDDVLAAAVDPERRRNAQEALKRALQLRALATRVPGFKQRIREAWPAAQVRMSDDGLHVVIRGCAAIDLEPLRGMPLRRLDCSNNQIVNLDPLAGMDLRELRCGGNRIRSLDALRDMPLSLLDCARNRIKSLSPLTELPLEEIYCAHNRIGDLAPLRRLALTALDCSDNPVTSLSALAGMPLVSLRCQNCRLTSLESLHDTQIAQLWCGGNELVTLDGLEGLPLRYLNVVRNPLVDITALAQAEQLEDCYFDETRISGFGPLLRHPPPQIGFAACPELSESALEAARLAWGTRSDRKLLVERVDVGLALRRGDVKHLRKMARPVGLRRALLVRDPCTWDEAAHHAEALGGMLCCPASPEEDAALREAMPRTTQAWIGLRGKASRWIDGRGLSWNNFTEGPDNSGGVLWTRQGWLRCHPADPSRRGFIVAW